MLKMSANDKAKVSWRTALPISIACALMILASILSAYFGFNLLLDYRASFADYHIQIDYASLYGGILNLVAFGLDLFISMLLLLRKHVALAEVLTSTVLAVGLATPFIFTYYYPSHIYMNYEIFWLKGLLAGLPTLAFSVPTLILTWLSRRKLKQDLSRRWTILPFAMAGASMVLASLLSGYSGLTLLTSYPPYSISSSLYGGLYNLVTLGFCLLAGLLLLKRKYVWLGAILAVVTLAIMLATPSVIYQRLASNLAYT